MSLPRAQEWRRPSPAMHPNFFTQTAPAAAREAPRPSTTRTTFIPFRRARPSTLTAVAMAAINPHGPAIGDRPTVLMAYLEYPKYVPPTTVCHRDEDGVDHMFPWAKDVNEERARVDERNRTGWASDGRHAYVPLGNPEDFPYDAPRDPRTPHQGHRQAEDSAAEAGAQAEQERRPLGPRTTRRRRSGSLSTRPSRAPSSSSATSTTASTSSSPRKTSCSS